MKSSNVVLSSLWNRNYIASDLFIRSLRRSNLSVPMIVFTSSVRGVCPSTVRSIPFGPEPRWDNICYRFVLYRNFLKENSWIQKALLSDISDVAFLSDPFGYDYPDGVCCFLEDDSATIGTCGANSKWVKNTDYPLYMRLKDKQICNAGVIVGDRISLIEYLGELEEAMNRRTWPLAIPTRGYSHPWGLDQVRHNELVYFGNLPYISVFRNRKGPVLTMAHMPDSTWHNTDGSIPPILHQYDRHPVVLEKVKKDNEAV